MVACNMCGDPIDRNTLTFSGVCETCMDFIGAEKHLNGNRSSLEEIRNLLSGRQEAVPIV